MMETFDLDTASGTALQCYRWLPDQAPKATIQIAHGMGEHAKRYDWTAQQLNSAGYAVYAADHRGHGATCQSSPGAQLGDLGPGGWDKTIADVHDLHLAISRDYPDLPQVLFGHSMGAMITQQYLYRFGDSLSAAVISGSPGFGGRFQLWLSHTIARFESWRHGHDGESALLDKLLFGDANKPFESPDATGFEWLSRDPSQVGKYIDDPLCGFVLRAGSVAEMVAGSRQARSKAAIASLPAQLPVYLFSGSEDPVHSEEKGLQRILTVYRHSFSKVTYKLYSGGRHEMLNETNRQEVIDDLARWLSTTLN